jgi:hypothetical protein
MRVRAKPENTEAVESAVRASERTNHGCGGAEGKAAAAARARGWEGWRKRTFI